MMRLGMLLIAVLNVGSLLYAQSWPTYRHDARRSGVSNEALDFPLQQVWVRVAEQPPQTAWTGPAKWDAYSGNSGLQSMRNFDPCFFVTAAAGKVFFGSSVDDAAHALDAATGEEQWVHFTGAAVRFPPTLDSGRAYFGSDDGYVYCCDAQSGDLVWQRQASMENKHITSNRKIISLWPVRTGVLIHNGQACFAGSLVPWKPSFLWKVDAATGEIGDGYRRELTAVTLQGALLASSQRIYVPQGRAAPLAFDFASGKPLGAIGEAGGVFCVLTEDEMLLTGPQNQKSTDDQIRIADAANRRRLATFSGTNRILVDGNQAWIPAGGKLKLLDRAAYVAAQRDIDAANAVVNNKKLHDVPAKADARVRRARATQQQSAAWKWEIDCPAPSGFIKAADAIIVGLADEVRIYSAGSGNLIWRANVDGFVHGLAVAQGRLFVSTGLGHIYAFGSRR